MTTANHDRSSVPSAANRFGWDYRQKAKELGSPVGAGTDGLGIIDVHSHINGMAAAEIYKSAARTFGIGLTYTQTRLDQADNVRAVLGETVRFVAVPNFANPDKHRGFCEDYLEQLEIWRTKYGARMMKLWNAPRLRELIPAEQHGDIIELDSPWRRRQAARAVELGMMIMTHVSDPDTWFATKYSDAKKYGTKLDQYRGLRVMLNEFKVPWVLAHMGGWPEDLHFLDALLTAHPNANLDTSATKWIVRGLSSHEDSAFHAFFSKWKGRILFGSDIVTTDDHVTPKDRRAQPNMSVFSDLADSPEAAFDLYASRYWALRAMFESAYDGESPIADPDLAMVDPSKYDAMSAPRLKGRSLPKETLRAIYFENASRLFRDW